MGDVLKSIAIIAGIMIFVFLGAAIFAAMLSAFSIDHDNSASLGLIIAESIVSAILMFLYMKEERITGLLPKLSARIIIYTVIIGMILQLIPLLIYASLSLFFGFENDSNIVVVGNIIIVFVLSCIVAPVMEELCFRAVLYSRIRKATGFTTAAIISSIVFAVFHFDLKNLPVFFLAGMILAYVYEKQGNIIINIIIHAVNNVVAFFAYYLLIDQLDRFISCSPWVDIGLGITGMILLVVCLNKMNKYAVEFIYVKDDDKKINTTSKGL